MSDDWDKPTNFPTKIHNSGENWITAKKSRSQLALEKSRLDARKTNARMNDNAHFGRGLAAKHLNED